MRVRSPLLLLLSLLSACFRPPQIRDEAVLREVTARFRAFYPAQGDPDKHYDAGLLRPRFGLPAIVVQGDAFEVQLLMRHGAHEVAAVLLQPDVPDDQAARCLEGPLPITGCYPLRLSDAGREPVATFADLVRLNARPARPPPPGGYDLYLRSKVDAPARVPRAVWLRADDPARVPALNVVHLSDLHVGKGRRPEVLLGRLGQVIADINALRPDLVVVTGDVVHRGQDPALAQRAQALLLRLAAPLLVVMGNHDIEFRVNPFSRAQYEGWPHFARVFHPFREFKLSLGGYDFVGFDSGPAERSPRVLTRGLAPASIETLRGELQKAQETGRRGVVLFSHAPSRATLLDHARHPRLGFFGRMRTGVKAFERMLYWGAARGQIVLHLAGHTHWSDVFELNGQGFAHWPGSALSPCLRPIAGRAAIITTQAATHSGVSFKRTARGYGFALLRLSGGAPEVAFRRYGLGPAALHCS
jgi:Icc-related predicted phosphoesterase